MILNKNTVKSLIAIYSISMSYHETNTANYTFVPFDFAMRLSQSYEPNTINEEWLIIKKLYQHNLVQNNIWQETPTIPKIIHHIWLGSPFPEKYKKIRDTWIKNHPNWKYILWTDKEIETFGLYNQKAYDQTSNYGCKSDIARYEILYRMGGLYVDTDFECIKPFDVFHHHLHFYAGIAYDTQPILFNGLIGASPQHKIIKKCIDSIELSQKIKESSNEIMDRTGPFYFTRCFFKIIATCKDPVAALPVSYFYPWPHFRKNENNPYTFIQEESYAIHHWHTSWTQ